MEWGGGTSGNRARCVNIPCDRGHVSFAARKEDVFTGERGLILRRRNVGVVALDDYIALSGLRVELEEMAGASRGGRWRRWTGRLVSALLCDSHLLAGVFNRCCAMGQCSPRQCSAAFKGTCAEWNAWGIWPVTAQLERPPEGQAKPQSSEGYA